MKREDEVTEALLITVDGPAGAGKSTAGRALAKRLGYNYIDTGALYRSVAYEAKRAGIRPNDDEGLKCLCAGLDLSFSISESGLRLISGGKDIAESIRTSEIAMDASTASAQPSVRSYLLTLQRRLAEHKRAVFEGRDMGTVVFPDADVKFYLDASLKIRAKRRYDELRKHITQTLEEVETDLKKRDEKDRTRALSPLKPAKDAIRIDSSRLTLDEVVDTMIACIRKIEKNAAFFNAFS
ncbi:MAG: (d)CMP kinase [Pseudomonadota bacterium]